jgi:hypothetical protein
MILGSVNLKPNIKNITLFIFLMVMVCSLGCQNRPRMRMGAYFGSVIEMTFAEPNDLGRHYYTVGLNHENLGMVYTCKAGFIDIGHLRESADRTKYVYDLAKKNISQQQRTFKFKVIDPAVYKVTIDYPYGWENFEEDYIIEDISLHLAQYIGHCSTIWHEIITWFHFKSHGLFSENISSFSWEDTYSDLLGTHLAVQALKDRQNGYDDTMTMLIDRQIKLLGPLPPKTAKLAKKKITNKWFKGNYYFFVKMQKRNFDVGIDDGFITPWLVPGICENSQPKLLAAPEFERFQKYGLKIDIEILPVEFEKNSVLKIISTDKKRKTIKPHQDFGTIIKEIKKQAVELYGDQVETPIL